MIFRMSKTDRTKLSIVLMNGLVRPDTTNVVVTPTLTQAKKYLEQMKMDIRSTHLRYFMPETKIVRESATQFSISSRSDTKGPSFLAVEIGSARPLGLRITGYAVLFGEVYEEAAQDWINTILKPCMKPGSTLLE